MIIGEAPGRNEIVNNIPFSGDAGKELNKSLALQNGADVKTVSSMLGHCDAGFTLRTYTHTTRQMQRNAAEKMGDFMAQIM